MIIDNMAAATTIDDIVELLGERDVRPWTPVDPPNGFSSAVYTSGNGGHPFELCVAPVPSRPTVADVRTVWTKRHRGRANPLLLLCPFPSADDLRTHVCGPETTDPTVVADADFDQALRVALAALDEPDRLAAVELLAAHPLGAADDGGLVGIRNNGMFAEHELRIGARLRQDWGRACAIGRQLRGKTGRGLVEALNFEIETLTAAASLLRVTDGRARAVAVFLDRSETPEGTSGRFGEVSAVSYGLAQADREDLPFVVLTRGSEIRLYAASRYAGVGRKGRAETFVAVDVNLLSDEATGYLPLVFGAQALAPGGTFEELLDRSRDFAADLSVRLRERVYNDVVPGLAVAVAEASEGAFAGERADLDFLYRETLVLLFRILFIAYAEDRELLPYRSSEAYRQAALKTMARRLADAHDAGLSWEDTQTTALWADLNKLREAVDEGSPAWSVPAYDGGLFSSDPDTSVVGAALAGITLPDSRLAPALTALLVEKVDDGACGPIDFRTLSVRDFGTIYEGLLESSLSRAPFDLSVAVDNEGRESFVRAEPDAEIVVPVGSIYHHNRSGERKSTGSYFTKEVAVEHLLERTLEPALSRHLTRVSALLESANELAARDAFFDFRCVDLAMGSGHFLVAAVDHIEERFTSFLVEHPISGVSAELGRLEASAADLLGQRADFEIETSTLMRRLIARRCVYGVDRNEIAVELARLSIWIHTFVPGLPLSYLDHNLVVGDSLTGIARIDEVLGAVLDAEESGTASFFEGQILAWLDEASASLRRLANVADATPPEIREARRAHAEAKEAVEPVRRLFDLVCAIRRGEAARFTGEINHDTINEHADLRQTELASKAFQALHFPVAFPEVFLRTNPGFDCIIGNPPWDKVLWEPMQFWIPRMPGLNTLGPTRRDAEMGRLRELYPADAVMEERHAAERRRYQEHVKSAYWQQGSAHYDSAKLFVERALQLLQIRARPFAIRERWRRRARLALAAGR